MWYQLKFRNSHRMHAYTEKTDGNTIPKSNLKEELVKEMELPEIFQGLDFASSGDNGLALTVT